MCVLVCVHVCVCVTCVRVLHVYYMCVCARATSEATPWAAPCIVLWIRESHSELCRRELSVFLRHVAQWFATSENHL